ncbi:MAG: biotin/lipoyl-binding protein, partial [Acidobacteriia bacterium]|nr:biotin/lipoyl-binding protein [Terriglobia bacterium]
MKKLGLALLVVAVAGLALGVFRKSSGPTVNFVQAKRTTLVSSLPTNGKVEPFAWQAIRAERAGILASVTVRDGQPVNKDEVIATISDPSLQSEIQGAEARVAEARANLSGVDT